MNEQRHYPSDEGYTDDTAPILSVFFGGNLDWYIAIEFTDHQSRYSGESIRRMIAVRVTTSGQRVPGLPIAVQALWKALDHECARKPVLGDDWIKWSLGEGVGPPRERVIPVKLSHDKQDAARQAGFEGRETEWAEAVLNIHAERIVCSRAQIPVAPSASTTVAQQRAIEIGVEVVEGGESNERVEPKSEWSRCAGGAGALSCVPGDDEHCIYCFTKMQSEPSDRAGEKDV